MSIDYASASIDYGSGQSITLLELTKQLMGVVGASRDDELTLLLQFAGEAAETYVDNKLVLQQVEEYQESLRIPVALHFYPFKRLESVHVSGDEVTDQWNHYRENGLDWLTTTACATERNECFKQLKIVYDAGHDPLPADVGYAIARTAVDYSKDSPQEAPQVRKETVVGVGSLEYDLGDTEARNFGVLTAETMTVLDRYKRISA